MLDIKSLTVEELKSDYIDRWGFVFRSSPFPIEKCQLISDTLIQHGLTTEQPEFVVELDDSTKVFVYSLDVYLDGPTLFQKSLGLRPMGIQVDILKAFLNSL